jgi:hypothetical protein
MDDLIGISMKNVNRRSIFSEIIIVDFYDGPTEAICKIISSNDWVIASLVYFGPHLNERIFSIISVTDDWLNRFESGLQSLRNNNFECYWEIKHGIEKYSRSYSGNAYLLKCGILSAEVYEIVQIKSDKLEYFPNIESVLTQKKEYQSKWIGAFIESR